MSRLRILAVLVVFVGLASFELFTGFSRLSALREERSRELISAVTRGHEQLAGRLQELLQTCERQSAYLAGLPDVSALISAREPRPVASLERAGAALRSFLDAFADVEGVLLLDAEARPLLHLVRGPAGVVMPSATPPHDDRELADVLRRGVVVPALEPAGSARPPCVASAVREEGRDVGWVVLSLSPGPLQAALAGFHPVEHLHTWLVPDDGPPSEGAGGGLPSVVGAPPRADAEGLVLASRIHDEPGFRLETRVPDRAFDAATAPLGREYAWIVGSMVVVTAALGLVGAFVLRLGQRAFRLHETEHYLRWIRRVTDRYRALMEGAADMILIVEPGGGLREANAAARATLGLQGSDPLEPNAAPLVAPADVAERISDGDRERFAAALRAVSSSSGRPEAVAGLRIRSAAGPELIVDGHFSRVDLGEEQVVEVSLRDVTRQRAVERRLQTAERLSSLGLLTAGVAHEINNPLEGIGNYLALLERPELEAAPRERYIGEIRRGLRRIRDIVNDLLTFARPSVETGRADLRQVVDNALGLVRYSPTFRAVEVEREGFDVQPLEIAGDGRRLEQVVLNLLLNAARAMEGRGRVLLRASRRAGPGGVGEGIALEVADTGPGIREGEADRLFDPFYSGSGGTGLGLSVSFGIVEAHGGTISAANRPGGGAVFKLVLPAAVDGDGGDDGPDRGAADGRSAEERA